MLFQLGRQLGIELDEGQLVAGQIFLGKDGVGRALGNADGAVNALVGVDHQHVRAFAEAVHGAYVHAIGVFALDAVLGRRGSWGFSCSGYWV
jgi:hypothetical protein